MIYFGLIASRFMLVYFDGKNDNNETEYKDKMNSWQFS